MDELRQAYIQKLGKSLDMEQCIVENLPSMIEASVNKKLHKGLTEHLRETREHVARVEKALASHKSGEIGEKDDAFRLMIKNAGKEIESIDDPATRDAVIIAAAQSVEHIEMARYGTLVEWAKALDEDGAIINALKKTLDEEKAADSTLSSAAEGGIFSTGVNKIAAH